MVMVVIVIATMRVCARATGSIVEPASDDWTIIGTKGGCTLFHKNVNGRDIYWSVCNSYNSSSISTE